MAGDAGPRRYDRVWLCRRWDEALRMPLAPPERAAAAAWIAGGRPLVAARRDPACPGAVALGLALAVGVPHLPLPSGERAGERGARRRVAIRVDAAAVVRVAPPLRLRDVIASAPAAWRASLEELDEAARRAGLVLRVHGSLAWQHLSGEPHVTPASDVDLLVRPRDGAALARALRLLGERAHLAAPRLDGEVLLGRGRGVAWRELAGAAERLLVKSPDGVALLPRAEVMAGLGEVAR